MKRSYIRKWLTVTMCLVLYSSIQQHASAQHVAKDFRAPQYQEAIEHIATTSDGELSFPAIISLLSGEYTDDLSNPADRSTLDGEYITVDPVIRVVSFSGDEDALFNVVASPDDSIITELSFSWSPSIPDWISGDSIIIDGDSSWLFIDVLPNLEEEARSTGIIIHATVGTVEVASVPAYIIQEGNPGSFIMVSPEIQAVSYEGGITEAFDIIHFNITDWELAPGTLPGWMSVDTADHTADTLTLYIDANTGDSYREDTIMIREVNNSSVSTQITIIQGAESASSILVTQHRTIDNYINSGW